MFDTKAQILLDLDPRNPASVQALIDFHRSAFGGFVMVDDAGDGSGGDAGKGDQGDGGKAADAAKGTDGKGGDEPLGAPGRKALEAEREARRRIEDELKQMKAGIAEAFGGKSKDAKSDDVLATLQAEMQTLRHENLVSRVARTHAITDADDLELIASSANADAMEKLAVRLAKSASNNGGGGTGDDGAKPKRTPKPDASQGQGSGGNNSRPTSVKEVMDARAAERAAKK